jgi:hypothetical protein
MKLFLLLLALFVTTQAFGADVCSFTETSDFLDTIEAKNIKPSKRSKNHTRFTAQEKELIHQAIKSDRYYANVSIAEALIIFGDYYEGQMGSNAGELVYFKVDGKELILVHYWPGDNEYGAFFETVNGKTKLKAKITDSFIDCI